MEATHEIDLQTADSARFRELLENMKFGMYRRCRAQRADKPLSYFEPLGWSHDELVQLENRYQREQRA